MKNLISHLNNNLITKLILLLLCGFVFLISTDVQAQSSEKPVKFLQIGGKVEMYLPILIQHNNESTAKPFDTYHIGMNMTGFVKTKEIFPGIRLALNGGYFIITDIETFLRSALADPSTTTYYNYNNDDHYVGAIGLEGGPSLIFKDALEIGVMAPWGTGNTQTSDYKKITGVTPYIQYTFKKLYDADFAIKCQFPVWKSSLRNRSMGLMIGFTISTN